MPTIDIPDKICPHCGTTKWFMHKRKYKDKIYIKYTCTVKLSESNIKFRKNNPDKLKEYRKKSRLKNGKKYSIKAKEYSLNWYLANKEITVQRSKEWAKNNPEKHKELRKKLDKKASNNLSDRYLKSILSDDNSITYSDVTQDLIEIKRKQLLLKRKSKQNG
jgi:hypothetical protein